MKLLIVGKSATGKDTVADILASEYGYKRAESCTTRPKRTPDEKGHQYVESTEGYEKIAPVTINGYEYFLTKQQILVSDVIIVEPSGIEDVCKAFPDEAFYMLYITADEKIRRELYKRRNPNATDAEFNKREYEENERFETLEKALNSGNAPWRVSNAMATIPMENQFDEKTMNNMVQACHELLTRHMNMKILVRSILKNKAVPTDEDNNPLVQEENGSNSVTSVPIDIFTAICLSSDKNKMDLFELWLTTNK